MYPAPIVGCSALLATSLKTSFRCHPLSGPGIKVLGMTKEEQHMRKVEQLMEFL
jgi:hypothetical protein